MLSQLDLVESGPEHEVVVRAARRLAAVTGEAARDFEWQVNLNPQQRQMVMAALGAGATYGMIPPVSCDHETEADQMGLLSMARAGYDPQEAVAFWERMSTAGGQQPPAFASTHPSHGQRIEDLRAFMPQALEEYQKAGGR